MQSKMKVVIIGAGIIGASAAYELQSRGADVLVIDAGKVRATDASFGWINASFFETPEYFALRVEGIEAYRRLEQRLKVGVSWCGSLAWEFSGDALDEQFQTLNALGYPCELLGATEIAALEPDLGAVPKRAIRFASEAIVEPTELAEGLLNAAKALGAQVASGFSVIGFEQRAGRITGVRTLEGNFPADQVIVAAGTGIQHLLGTLNIALPMLHRPALVLKTHPVKAQISHVLATDFGEVRQLRDGSILTPASVGHQADASEQLASHPLAAAKTAMDRLRVLFPDLELELASLQLAHRPVPKDGFPAVGSVAEGLYAATLHSGITLAPLMGELIADEVLNGVTAKTEGWLSSFRPERFI